MRAAEGLIGHTGYQAIHSQFYDHADTGGEERGHSIDENGKGNSEGSGNGTVKTTHSHAADEDGNVHGKNDASRVGDHVESLGQHNS